jgi:hypothetical protein
VWDSFIQHNTLEEVLNDTGLAKTGDAIVNLCYSLAKSLVLGRATGEKVRDDVLAKAIRETSLYRRMNKRTDRGTAADSYEAVIAYLWMSKKVTIDSIVSHLIDNLSFDATTSRKKEAEIASEAFKLLLDSLIPLINI